ncbi:Pentatricopeptide repeat-containing protein, partial [Mucuna pruriens]
WHSLGQITAALGGVEEASSSSSSLIFIIYSLFFIVIPNAPNLDPGMTSTHNHAIFLLLSFLFFCFHTPFSHAANSITMEKPIRDDDDGATLVSEDLTFEMGFFGSDNSSRYVGIWYHDVPSSQAAYVWVANRERPIRGRGGSVGIKSDGNLVVLDGENNEVWSSSVSIPMKNNSQAVLGNDGNLVLSYNDKTVWQSFQNPTDTFVPGMKLPASTGTSMKFSFRSWKSATDPSPGNYTMGVDTEGLTIQILILEGEKRRWRTGYWDNSVFTGVSNMTGSSLYGFGLNTYDNGGKYFTYTWNKTDKVRFQITWNGFEKRFIWIEDEKQWNVTQYEPYNQCEHYNFCGSFAVCDMSNSRLCSCMQKFKPRHLDEWNSGNFSGGCERMTSLKAERGNSSGTERSVGEDGFLMQRFMKLPDFARLGGPVNDGECQSYCLQNSSCTAYSYTTGIGCMTWYGELVDVQRSDFFLTVLNIRLARSDLGDGDKKTKIWIILAVVGVGLICLGIVVLLVWRFKRKPKPKVSSASGFNNGDVPVFELTRSTDLSAEFSGSTDFSLEGNQLSGAELPLFNFSCVVLATNNFSEENKLGQGGFGPVYKGMLPGGEQIAAKRLSRKSSQGLEEFKNEMMLIAKLQHRNLVRLLGCSIQGEEKILVYEYLPNKSLDRFLFDPVKQTQLDWTRRFEIIEGIARGLLYLHRDSRLRIIHRDLKASNILLDESMNPKISDFGLARIFGGNQNEANTNRVVGTYGYMSPEYAMEGLFSVKSDVYSFGVLLLEIVSGRRNTSFRNTEESSLIGYAWRLWSEQRVMELVDHSIRDSIPKSKVLRCIHIGMLCVQDSASRRPNMSSVVLMLESEATTLPLPRQPLLTSMRKYDDGEFHTDGLDVSNDLTVTMYAPYSLLSLFPLSFRNEPLNTESIKGSLMEQTRKLMKGVLKNTKNPKLAWHLVKRVLSSPSTTTDSEHLVAITTRILGGATMHRELDDLQKLILASQPHHIAYPSIICMVRVLAQSGHIDEALSHFKSLRAQFPSTPPSLPFYNLLLRLTLQHNRPHLVTWLYTDMIAARVTPQTYTFNLLLQSLCESRAFDHALELFDKMSEKGCHPNEFTLGILVRGLCRAGLVKRASELVNSSRHNANRVVYNTLVSRFCREELNDEAEKLVEIMSQQGVLPDVVTFNSRVSALCRAGKVLEASRIFRDMQMDQELGLPRPNVVTFNLMLKGFCKQGMMEDARGLVDTMKKVGNFVSLESYNIWLLGLLRNGELLEARLVLDEMVAKGVEPNAYTYNIMMDGLCRNHMLSDARGLMDLMMSNGVYPDTVTYSTLLHGYCSKGKVFEAKNVLHEMIRNGCQPNTYTCNTLLHSLWKEGRTQEAEEVLQKMNEKCYQPDTVTCNIVVNGLCRNGELDKAIEIVTGRLEEAKKKFIEMLAKNLHPDSVTYDTFIWSFCKQGKISSAFRVLKDMERNGCSKTLKTYNALILGLGSKRQIFEIYGLMDEMREKGINPDICTYNNIISCLCEGGKAQDAISLLHEMLDKGISPNISSFKILIKAFCKSSDFKVASELFEVALTVCGHNEALYSLMFNELLAGGQLSEAKELFEASLDRYLTVKNFMYKDLIARLCQDERLADANSLLHKLIDKGYGFDHASFMPVIDGLSKRGNKQEADELAKRMMELALEDRTTDGTCHNRKRTIPGKLRKNGGSDWQDIVNRDAGSGIALKTLKRVQKGWGQGSISSLQSQQNDFLDYYDDSG